MAENKLKLDSKGTSGKATAGGMKATASGMKATAGGMKNTAGGAAGGAADGAPQGMNMLTATQIRIANAATTMGQTANAWVWRNWLLHFLSFLPFFMIFCQTVPSKREELQFWFVLLFQVMWLLLAGLNLMFGKGRVQVFLGMLHVLVAPFMVPIGWLIILGPGIPTTMSSLFYVMITIIISPRMVGACALVSGITFAIGQKVFWIEHTAHIPMGDYLKIIESYIAMGLIALAWRWFLSKLHQLLVPAAAAAVSRADGSGAAAAHAEEILQLRAEMGVVSEERQALRTALAFHIATIHEEIGFEREYPAPVAAQGAESANGSDQK